MFYKTSNIRQNFTLNFSLYITHINNIPITYMTYVLEIDDFVIKNNILLIVFTILYKKYKNDRVYTMTTTATEY